MAHTLTIHDGVETTDIALAATAATGYHLIAYNPIMSAYIDQRNASPYLTGDYSVMGKYQNIIETITCEIVGTSRDDLFVKLRALYRAIENARDYVQFPNQRSPSYLTYQPDSTTNASYSCILGGRIDIPGTDASITMGAGGEGEQLNNTMTGIVITIEREPFWRSGAPVISYASIIGGASGVTTSPWASLDAGTIPGDIPAPVEVLGKVNAAGILDIVWFGYSSRAHKGTGYDGAGVQEAEGGAMGTDTSAIADATASPGGGTNNKARCTFATVATDAERVTLAVAPGYGVFRVFARCQLSAAGTVTLYVKAKSSTAAAAQKISNTPVTITHTAWRMIDLGIVALPILAQQGPGPGVLNRSLIVSASRSAGACSLDIDFLFLLPIDEGVIQVKGAALPSDIFLLYSNIMPGLNTLYVMDVSNTPSSFPQWSGYIRFPPGPGYLYALGGDANFANVLGANSFTWSSGYYTAYLTARGNG